MTVSGVHAASCLAASEKPANDKQGLRHATPSTRGRGDYHRYLNAGSIDASILCHCIAGSRDDVNTLSLVCLFFFLSN